MVSQQRSSPWLDYRDQLDEVEAALTESARSWNVRECDLQQRLAALNERLEEAQAPQESEPPAIIPMRVGRLARANQVRRARPVSQTVRPFPKG